MAIDIDKVPYPEHPDRCKGMGTTGQCNNMAAVAGGRYCKLHGGAQEMKAEKEKRTRMYRLQKWQERLDEFAESDDLKSLREEIGILRILMEERFSEAKTPVDLLIQAPAIADLTQKITNTVQACHKMEQATGNLLDKQAVLRFADVIIRTVSEVFAGQDTKIAEVADKILESIPKLTTDDFS